MQNLKETEGNGRLRMLNKKETRAGGGGLEDTGERDTTGYKQGENVTGTFVFPSTAPRPSLQ